MVISTKRFTTTANQTGKTLFRASATLTGCLIVLFLTLGVMKAQAELPRATISKDGTPIFYEVFGAGEPTIVFVHGWSCDARYWRAQRSYFSKSHRIVTLDLAGHGHSGITREHYSMLAFGEDVQAVVKAIGDNPVILVGHSMGGWVIAETARLMPDKIIGLIGIDTLGNIEYPMTKEEYTKMIAALKQDFRLGCREFVSNMISPATGPELREWILADMSAASPAVALSALKALMSQYITGNAAKLFDELHLPVVTVNADLWPINYEANRRHMQSFEAIILKGTDHFLMLNQPEIFNNALEKAITIVLKKRNK